LHVVPDSPPARATWVRNGYRAIRLDAPFRLICSSRERPCSEPNSWQLEENIRRAGRRLSLALVAGGVWIGTATAAASAHVAGWVAPSLAGLGAVLTLGFGIDLLSRRA
jgi:hypothetical protein